MTRSSDLTAWQLTRAAGVGINGVAVTQRANQFAAKTEAFDSTVLLLRREGDTMLGYLLTSGTGGDSLRAAADLAQTVGAKAVPVEVPEGLDEDNVVGWMTYESGSSVARDPQVHADPAETARQLANTLSDGGWVAVSLRKPSKKERSRNGTWLAHRLSTSVPNHHSLSPDAVLISVFAGGEDPESVRNYLSATRSAMPGFDVITRPRVATRSSALMPWAPTAVGMAGLGVGSLFAGVPNVLGPALLVPALVLGTLLGVIAGGRFAGFLPSAWRRTQAMAANCDFPAPPKRRGRPAAPQREVTTAGKERKARDGDYPLNPASFLVGPQVVVGVVAPQAGAVSGESETKSRAVPPVLLQRIGPLIGDTDQGPAHLSAWDHEGQVAIAGRAGSGKSVLVRSLFGWSCLERQQPSGIHGFPGARNALIAFESKGDGVRHYEQWAEATNDNAKVVDITDPNTLGIDVFAVPGTVFDKANFFVNALKYAFGEQSIGPESFATLLCVIPAAMLVTPEMAASVPDLPTNGSPIFYTHVLLGGRGDDTGRLLAAELSHASVLPDADPMLREAVINMSPLYGSSVTAAQRKTLQKAPQNKLRHLVELEPWWTPSRRKVSWSLILEKHRAVVINTGTSTTTGSMVEDELNQQIASILMYSLRHAIQRTCSGWQEQQRYVSIFADELSLLAGSSEAVIAWLKDQGRSFGVRSFLATQRPEQLPDRVRKAFLNFSTFISFTQEDLGTAKEIADAVSAEEGEWSSADILQLNTYSAVVRTHVNKKRQAAFTMKARNFEGDRSMFATEQGYFGHISEQPLHFEVEAEPEREMPVLADPVVPAPLVTAPVEPEDDGPRPDLMNW